MIVFCQRCKQNSQSEGKSHFNSFVQHINLVLNTTQCIVLYLKWSFNTVLYLKQSWCTVSDNMPPPFFFPLFSFFFLMPINAINTDVKKTLLRSLKINYEIMHQNAAYTPTALQYTQWQCIGKSTVNIHFVTFSQFRKYRLRSKERRKELAQQFPLSFIHCHYCVRCFIFQDCHFPAKWNAKLLKPWEIIRKNYIHLRALSQFVVESEEMGHQFPLQCK